MEHKKNVDESWKESVDTEKETLRQSKPSEESAAELEVNFVNYVSSLVFQAMIFLGQIPNPVADNKIEPNLKQARLLIDTLTMLRDKTKGNLSEEEENLLNNAVYELQLNFVEQQKKGMQK